MPADRASALAKVAKLIPSLSRDSENEVLATVRHIGRALQSGGLDFHDLARLVEGVTPAKPAPADRGTASSGLDPVPLAHSRTLVMMIIPHRSRLLAEHRAEFDRLDGKVSAGRPITRAEHDVLREFVRILNL